MLQPQIVEKPALSVVGFEAPFIHVLSPDSTAAEVIVPLWDKIFHNVSSVPYRLGDAMYGVVYGRAEGERSHPDEMQYIAAAPVSEQGELPEGMVSRTVPAHTFAVFIHRGPIANIGDTCEAIYRQWLPQSGYEHAGIADVELYDQRFCYDSDESEMEYWISVKPKDESR